MQYYLLFHDLTILLQKFAMHLQQLHYIFFVHLILKKNYVLKYLTEEQYDKIVDKFNP
jgi:hypothetical protein